MTVLIFDENILWSSRLKSGVTGLGHEAVVLDSVPESLPAADIAILNLASTRTPATQLLPMLADAGVKTIAHAGHKESSLLEAGRSSGADLVVTNGELTHKLAQILASLA